MSSQSMPAHDKQPNQLVHETSPYLLQHAYNPVNWYPWGTEALQRAKAEDKPIIVSIGYSACHWCHVMERECFENQTLAGIMNDHFICIKVDREERPDVDAIYMDAVQTMGVQGGWPLNVFLTPDAKPFYGGTYFPPQPWGQLLVNVTEAYKKQKEQLLESAEGFSDHSSVTDVQKYGLLSGEASYSMRELDGMFEKLASKFDRESGGMNRAPKFPMPSICLFMLRYFGLTENAECLTQLKLTLDRMAFGGIYDQIGGGFARYSVDGEWFAPHFEKMLYDNGQLLSLYAEAYAATKEDLYWEVVLQTVEFVQRELTSPEGGFYSALDADSEGIEGRFYVWTDEEWRQATEKLFVPAGMNADLFKEYFNVDPEGNWEHRYNILHRTLREEEFARLNGIDPLAFKAALEGFRQQLLTVRASRVRPGLDDKILCSWNGLMLKGLVDAYRVFGDRSFLELALQNAEFLKNHMRKGSQLYHSYKNGRAAIPGYLEDYAFVINAYIYLYQATFSEEWLKEAKVLTDYVVDHFYDPLEELFFFTDITAEKLIARKKELFDNVIPASNSVMATNLYWLGLLFDQADYTQLAAKMLARVKKLVIAEPQFLSNWACLFSYQIKPTAEVAIVGPEADVFRREIDQMYCPNKVLVGTSMESHLPLLQDRHPVGGKTTIYVCYNRVCQMPVFTVNEAMAQVMGAGKVS